MTLIDGNLSSLISISQSLASKRIVHVCTFPGAGGAGIASQRLVQGLRKAGANASMVGVRDSGEQSWISQIEYSGSVTEKIWRRYRNFQLRRINTAIVNRNQQSDFFSSDLCPHGAALANSLREADLVHLHWVCNLIDYSHTLAAIPDKTPIVWTCHDMAVFTGGCSYSFDCQEYTDRCARCPQLQPVYESEVIESFDRRRKAMRSIKNKLSVIGPSQWITEKSRCGSILKGVPHYSIANGIDLEVFHPKFREGAREQLRIPPDKFIILFVAARLDVRVKGMSILRDALVKLETTEQVEICFVGTANEHEFPGSWRWLGATASDSEIASIYSAADLLVVPSLADNFPNVICEALACGLPVVGSRIGGIPEMIDDQKTGFLVEPGDPVDLTRVVRESVTKIMNTRSEWSHRCREQAELKLGLLQCVEKHLRLYSKALDANEFAAES